MKLTGRKNRALTLTRSVEVPAIEAGSFWRNGTDFYVFELCHRLGVLQKDLWRLDRRLTKTPDLKTIVQKLHEHVALTGHKPS